MNTYIGIDLGTSGVKLLLVDTCGNILASSNKEYSVIYPQPGWTEQNPEDWWNATVCGISDLLKNCDKTTVKGISFGGQMHGLVVLDKDDNVIRPCILWNDGRTEKQTAYLNETIGSEKLSEYTGNIAFAGFTAPKLLWLKENEPKNFNKIAKIMLPKDYLAYRLSDIFCTDYSDASGTLLLDVKNKRWSGEMLNICGISEEQLPKLYESYEAVGTIKKEVAKMLGLPDTVKIVAGAGDNASAAIGTSTVENGDCNISLGTSGTVFIASDKFEAPRNNALHSFAHANGKYHLMGCILSAASANKWWLEEILKTADYDGATKGAIPGESGVFFLPYLMGERCPHNDVSARGAFLGMSASTTREEMSLAVLEGVAFALRDCVELAKESGITIKKSTVCGGGARSVLWLKIISSVLNMELQSVETEQGPSYGAAMLAMVGCGEKLSAEKASKDIVNKNTVAVPDEKLVALYEKCYAKYKKLYPLLREWYREE